MIFSFNVESKDTYKYIDLKGNLSVSSIDTFENLMSDMIEKSNVIINMEMVDIVTSSGLNSLLNFSFEAKNFKKRLFLLKPGKNFLNMVENTKSHDMLLIINSIEEGMMKLKYYL